MKFYVVIACALIVSSLSACQQSGPAVPREVPPEAATACVVETVFDTLAAVAQAAYRMKVDCQMSEAQVLSALGD